MTRYGWERLRARCVSECSVRTTRRLIKTKNEV
jgi:hypothetical protein